MRPHHHGRFTNITEQKTLRIGTNLNVQIKDCDLKNAEEAIQLLKLGKLLGKYVNLIPEENRGPCLNFK